MEWKEKHVVFMVGLHWGGTVVLPRMLREHYQRNLLMGLRVPAPDRIHRALENPGNPRATIRLFLLHAPPINVCGLGRRGHSVTPVEHHHRDAIYDWDYYFSCVLILFIFVPSCRVIFLRLPKYSRWTM